ncbi:Uncharacterised protein g7456 [Pycnogonum litorale]
MSLVVISALLIASVSGDAFEQLNKPVATDQRNKTWLTELLDVGQSMAAGQNVDDVMPLSKSGRWYRPRPLVTSASLKNIRQKLTQTQLHFLSLMDAVGTRRWTHPSCIKLLLCLTMKKARQSEKMEFRQRILKTLSLLHWKNIELAMFLRWMIRDVMFSLETGNCSPFFCPP